VRWWCSGSGAPPAHILGERGSALCGRTVAALVATAGRPTSDSVSDRLQVEVVLVDGQVAEGVQTLIVTAGLAPVQVQGGAIQQISPGDVVRIPPDRRHWHGATATTAMTHIALQDAVNGKVVQWMEKVSDDQYRAQPAVK
jgi:hypothetical protein